MGRDGSRLKGRGGGGRGSKKMFIANIDELKIRERKDEDGGSDDDDDDEEDEEVEKKIATATGETTGATAERTVFSFGSDAAPRQSRAELNAAKAAKNGTAPKKAAGDDEEDDGKPMGLLAGLKTKDNANKSKATDKMIKIKDINSLDDAPVDTEAGMNRKEKEALADLKKKDDYMKRHLAGETEEARIQLKQLAIVKERREAAAKKRVGEGRAAGWSANGVDSDEDLLKRNKNGNKQADSDEDSDEESSDDDSDDDKKLIKAAQKEAISKEVATKAAKIEDKKAKAADGEKDAKKKSGTSEPEKLKPMDIKKMNGDQLKDSLKERKLEIQGAKKDLIKRLLDFEAARA